MRQLGQMFRMEGKQVEKAPRVFSLRTAYLQYRAVARAPETCVLDNSKQMGPEGLQTTLGKLQLMADAVEAGGHLCSGAHATHLAHLHLFNPPITFAIPQGLQMKFLKKADIRPKGRRVLPFCSHFNQEGSLCRPLSCRDCEENEKR